MRLRPLCLSNTGFKSVAPLTPPPPHPPPPLHSLSLYLSLSRSRSLALLILLALSLARSLSHTHTLSLYIHTYHSIKPSRTPGSDALPFHLCSPLPSLARLPLHDSPFQRPRPSSPSFLSLSPFTLPHLRPPLSTPHSDVAEPTQLTRNGRRLRFFFYVFFYSADRQRRRLRRHGG
jgi:hypothetical protein